MSAALSLDARPEPIRCPNCGRTVEEVFGGPHGGCMISTPDGRGQMCWPTCTPPSPKRLENAHD